MDRKTKTGLCFILASCLASSAFAQDLIQHNIGKWTKIEGDSTFLLFKNNRSLQSQKNNVNSVIQTEGSYLTSENGEMTGQLFKNCWIKMGPKTKLVFSLSPTDKTLYLQVFTGSVHILFNKAWTDNQAEKLIINADEKQIETESGKFIFVRRPFFQDNSLYVKKGLVSLVNNMKPQAIFIHQNEKISFKDKADLNLEVEKMSERDIQELSGPKKTRKPE